MKYSHPIRSLQSFFIFLTMGTCTLLAQGDGHEKLTIQPQDTYQTVIGFGASLAYYENWLNAHPKKSEIYQAIFGELSLDILRVRNAYDYDSGMVDRVKEYVVAAENVLGYPISLFSTSWGPPGYLKNTGDRLNGGTLRYTTGPGGVEFDYAGFAHWWGKSLDEYNENGIYPDYISIQNEPNWSASWETNILKPTEIINATDTIAGYNKALDAVYDTIMQRIQKPKILGPEVAGIGFNAVEDYMNALDVDKLDGVAHHLYHGVDENNPYTSGNFSKVGDFLPGLPHFQTEYSLGDWFSLAGLIYKSFYDEQVVAYLYWELIWDGGGLVSLDNPWNQSQWTDPQKGYTKTKDFFAFKQFSAYIHPGWLMTGHTLTGTDGVALTFVSPSADSAVSVIINRSTTDDLSVRLNIPGYRILESSIYVTSETENCLSKGALVDSLLTLSPHSIVTVDMRIMEYDPLSDTVAPTTPDLVTISNTTINSLEIAWDPATDNVGVEGYRIFVDGIFDGNTPVSAYSISGLNPATAYTVTVSAYDDAGNESEPSDPVIGNTLTPDSEAPSIPENLVITSIQENYMSIIWDSSMDNVAVTGYNIYSNGVLAGTSTTSIYFLTQLTPNTSYQITVGAFDKAGNESAPSAPVTGTTLYFDREPPVLEATDSVYVEGIVEATSSETGMIYMVPQGTPYGLSPIRKGALDSIAVTAGIPVNLTISGLANGSYWLYAADTTGNISEPHVITVLGVGIEISMVQQINVFPNPFTQMTILQFKLGESQFVWLQLIDSQGREVRRASLGRLPSGEQQVTVHRADLKEGLYFFKLENSSGEMWTGRLVIQD